MVERADDFFTEHLQWSEAVAVVWQLDQYQLEWHAGLKYHSWSGMTGLRYK